MCGVTLLYINIIIPRGEVFVKIASIIYDFLLEIEWNFILIGSQGHNC